MPTPIRVTVRSYQVGFGDCFVLIFEYDDGTSRHMLIDLGTTANTKMPSRRSMLQIARDITKEADEALQVVIATHRHADHISGFAGKSGDVIAAAAPKLIVQSWTENPDIPPDATAPLGMIGALDSMHLIAQHCLEATNPSRKANLRAWEGASNSAVQELRFLGETNIKNKESVRNLVDMAAATTGFYAKHGDVLPVDDLLPGVTIKVLGPPTVDQWEQIRKEREEDKEEFWLGQQRYWATEGAIGASHGQRLFDTKLRRRFSWPFAARWVIPRIREIRGDQLLQIVRTLDDSLNNTSVILLIKVNDKSLLFSGDAQIEEWLWALAGAPEAAETRAELATVSLYKVGHHGSRNATPKRLWKLWEEAGRLGAASDLRTVVSTRGSFHGRWWKGTEVPRRTLTDALRNQTDFHTTQYQRAASAYRHDLHIDLDH